MGFKTSLAIAFTLLLIIPFLIKPVNGLYDIGELESLRSYCYLHADRAAKGENVVNDLIKTGLANSTYNDWSCSKISETLQQEEKAQSESETKRALAFVNHCRDGNMTPSQYWKCEEAGYAPSLVNGYPGSSGDAEICNFESTTDPLTPFEQKECRDTGHEPEHTKDKDTKESDK